MFGRSRAEDTQSSNSPFPFGRAAQGNIAPLGFGGAATAFGAGALGNRGGFGAADMLEPLGEKHRELEVIELPRFSFEAVKGARPRQPCAYMWSQTAPDLLPADGATALRELSEEDLGTTGPYGTLLHQMAFRYTSDVVEAAVGLFPPGVFSTRDEHGQTIFHAFAFTGRSAAAMERALEHTGVGALAIPSANGSLPIHLAAAKQLQSECPTLTMLLHKTPQEALRARNDRGENVLHVIAKNTGEVCVVEEITAALPSECLSARDSRGRTPLHVALEEGGVSILPLVRSAPVEVLTMEDDKGRCVLEVALEKGRLGSSLARYDSKPFLELIDAYIRNGVMERKSHWQLVSPLHIALERCHEDVVAALVACPQAREWALIPDPVTGILPLHYVSGGMIEFTRVHASTVIGLMKTDDLATPVVGTTQTALYFSVLSNHSACEQLLDIASHAFDVDAKDEAGRTLIARALCVPRPPKTSPLRLSKRILDHSKSDVPLTVAQWRTVCQFLDVSLLVALCRRYKTDFFESTRPEDWEGGSTPLHCACGELPCSFSSSNDGFRDGLGELLDLLPEWFLTVRDGKGFTPLHCAIVKGNSVAVDILLDQPSGDTAVEMRLDAPPEISCSGTPLEAAVKTNNPQLVKILLAKFPRLRRSCTAEGKSLVDLVESLHQRAPHRYGEVKQAFEPPVKSAAT